MSHIEHPPPAAPRRVILASLALTGAAPATANLGHHAQGWAHPDAELLTLAGEFLRLQHQVEGFYGEGPRPELEIADDDAREAAIEPIRTRQREIQEALADIRATTRDGLLARVRMLEAWEPMWRNGGDTIEDVIVFDLLQDIHALGGEFRA